MQVTDLINSITQAPIRLGNVYSAYVREAEAMEQNIMVYPAGRMQAVARMREEAQEAVQDIRANIEAAELVANTGLKEQRDKLKPRVDNATHERRARQLSYLVDRGVPLEDLISENITDPVTLRILEQELPVLARGREPQYKEAGRTFDELLHQAARETYGPEFRAADDKIKDLERGAYRAKVAASATLRALQEDDRTGLVVPAYQEGQLIEA